MKQMASHGKFITYYRVSTDKQGKSGLGLEAQRQAVATYLNGGDWKIIAEFTEVESGPTLRVVSTPRENCLGTVLDPRPRALASVKCRMVAIQAVLCSQVSPRTAFAS
jgi:hypothetical protein